MSIILDALKKVEGKKTQGESDSQTDGQDASQSTEGLSSRFGAMLGKSPLGGKLDLSQIRKNKRSVILVGVVVVLGLGLLVFGNPLGFLSSGSTDQEAAVNNQTLVQNQANQLVQKQVEQSLEEAKRLKKLAAQNFREGNLQEALKNYARLTILASTDPEIYNNYGVALRRSGQLDEARQAYDNALGLKKDYPEALNNLAVIDMSENKYHKAKERLLRAIEINPDYIDPYFHLAITLEKNGQVEDAIKYYERFLDMSAGGVDRTVRLQVEERLSKLKE